jgi:hypothetical protein
MKSDGELPADARLRSSKYLNKFLVENQPLPLPTRCDAVFAVIDTASKTVPTMTSPL